MAKSSTNTTGTKINWSKVAGKAATGAKTMFSPFTPNIVNTASNISNVIHDSRNALRVTKATHIKNEKKNQNSLQYKNSMNLFKSALNDIESGNYEISKTSESMYNDFESHTMEAFKMPTGDDAANISAEEIILTGNKGIAQSVIQSSNAQMESMQESTKIIVNSNIKSTKALAGALNNTLSFGFNSLMTSMNITNSKLDMVNSNLNTIIQFNNSNTLEFYTKSIDMLNGLGTMMSNMQKYQDGEERKKGRSLNTSFGFDPKEYFDYVKQGLKETFFGTAKNAVDMAKNVGSGKDMGIMGAVLSLLVPQSIQSPLNRLDKTFTRSITEAFKKFADKLDNDSIFAGYGLGEIFGTKRSKLNKLNMGRYEKGSMPWNGIAQKALVEVIPELLTSIDAKIDKSEKRYYDYDKGKFKNKSQIQNEFETEYFDRLTFALQKSMQNLETTANAVGRPNSDTNKLLTEIRALIDDQVTGTSSTKESRNKMSGKMRQFGINDTDTEAFIREFQESLENGIESINDMFSNIQSTQNIYRNVNLTHGKEGMRRITQKHANHRVDYSTFLRIPNPNQFISDTLKSANMTDIDVSLDRDLVDSIIPMFLNNSSDSDIEKFIKNYYRQKLITKNTSNVTDAISQKSGLLGNLRSNMKNVSSKIGSKLDHGVTKIEHAMYGVAYGDNKPIQSSTRSSNNDNLQSSTRSSNNDNLQSSIKNPRSAAKTYMTKNRVKSSVNTTQSSKATELILDSATTPYDAKMKQDDAQLDKTEMIIEKGISSINHEQPASTVADSIVQSNNSVKASLGLIVNSFQTFGARIFGKNGILKKFWESDTRKKITKKLKEILFTGKNAIFKKQYEGAKTGLKNLKDKTVDHLRKGYNKVYDSTMMYMYGENYQDNEDYKNNRFLSHTLNFEKRREEKIAAAKKAQEDAKKSSTNEPMTAKVYKKSSISDNVNASDLKLNKLDKNSSTDVPMTAKVYKKSSISDNVNASNIKLKKLDKKSSSYNINPSNLNLKKLDKSDDIKDTAARVKASINNAVDGVEKASSHMISSTKALTEVVVGDSKTSPEEKKKSYATGFIKKLKSVAPKALAAGIAGMGIGLLNNQFSLLGSMFLPGGPIAGAIVGGGLAILTQTEAFKTFMFGKLDEGSNKRQGGLISEKMQNSFKKMLPFAIGGATLGALKGLGMSALGFDSGLGILGMQILPGGILGGAILGAGFGILKNSETFKSLLFGKKNEDGKRSGTMLSNSLKKVKEGFKGMLPKVGKAVTGFGIGALSGAVLSNMGYLPAMLSFGGPVGMGILGLGVGIASSTKKFNEWMFGSQELDKDGNPIPGKRRKDGILTRVTNILRTNVIEPIGGAFKSKMLDLVDWTKDKITYPFRLAFGPILDSIIGIKDNVVDFVKDKFEALGQGIMSMMKNTIKSIFSPVTKLIGYIGKSIAGVASTGSKMALTVPSLALQGLQILTAGKRRKEYVDFYKDYYKKGNIESRLTEYWDIQAKNGKKRTFTQKIGDRLGAYIGHGEIADAAREGYNEKLSTEGKNHLNWRSVSQEKRSMHQARNQRHADEKQWRRIDSYRNKIINDDLGGREVTLNDYQLKRYKNKFKRYGIDEKYLQNSDDVMDLLYRRGEFKKKMNPNSSSPSGLVINETPEQKKAREQTEKYQTDMRDFLQKISNHFSDIAAEKVARDNIASEEVSWNKSKSKIGKKFRRSKIKGIKASDPRLRDWDIDSLTDDDLSDYKLSPYYDSGDLFGFMESHGVTQKSKYKSSQNRAKTKHEAPSKDANSTLVEQQKTTNALLNANLEASTGGEVNAETVKKRKGKSFGSRIMDKFNITQNESKRGLLGSLTSILNKKKKDDAKAAALALEDKESKEAREGTDLAKSSVNEPDDEPKSFLDSLLGKAKSITSNMDGSKMRSFLIKGLKFAGSVGLLGTLGFTIAELIRPGTSEKIGNKIDEFNRNVDDGTFSFKSVFENAENYVNEKLKSASDWVNSNTIPWVSDNILPTIKKVPEVILTALPNLIISTGEFIADHADDLTRALTTVITELVPPLVTALVTSTPALIKAIGIAGWEILKSVSTTAFNALMGALGLKKDVKKTDLSNEEILEINTEGKYNTTTIAEKSFKTYEDAEKFVANNEYENASIQKTASGYNVINNAQLGNRTAKNEDDEAVGVGNSTATQAIARTAMMLGIDAFGNGFGGNAIKGGIIAKDITKGGLRVGGSLLKGTGSLIGNTFGLPFRVIGSAIKGVGTGIKTAGNAGSAAAKGAAKSHGLRGLLNTKTNNVIDSVSHPINSSKSVISKYGSKLSASATNMQASAKNILNKFGSIFNRGGSKVPTAAAEEGAEKALSSLAKKTTESVPKETVEAATRTTVQKILDKIVKFASDLAENGVLKKTVERFTANGPASGAKNIIKKLIEFIISNVNKLSKVGGKGLFKLASLATAAMAKFTGKAAASAATFGIFDVVMIIGGGVLGALDAAHLFQVQEEDVTPAMRSASAVIEALVSTSFGTWVDLIFVALDLLFGYNFKKALAELLFNLFTGFNNEAIDKMKASQDAMAVEAKLYNELNGTNLDINAYNDLKNKTVGAKIVDFGKSAINKFGNLFGAKWFTEVDTKSGSEAYGKLVKAGYTNDQMMKWSESERNDALHSVGYGSSVKVAAGYGLAAQGDPHWANMPIGNFADGSVATMGTAGCGPTALSIVANKFANAEGYGSPSTSVTIAEGYGIPTTSFANNINTGDIGSISTKYDQVYFLSTIAMNTAKMLKILAARSPQYTSGSNRKSTINSLTSLKDSISNSLGFGKGVTPADMGAYAASNGYISNGGANAGLFTEGAARLGMRSTPVTNTQQLVSNLQAGRPTILTGKSSGGSNPYTSAGHIVVADRIKGSTASVIDPINGKRKSYNINSITKNTNHAWSYSTGYGPGDSIWGWKPYGSSNVRPTTPTTIWPYRSATGNTVRDAKYYSGGSRRRTTNSMSSGLEGGYPHTFAVNANGIDSYEMETAKKRFINYNKYYSTLYKGNFARGNYTLRYDGRVNSEPITVVGGILSRQYFNGPGNYEGIEIPDLKNMSIENSNVFSDDFLSKIIAAAILVERKKEGKAISSFSKVEKVVAGLSACRAMFGFHKTYMFFTNTSTLGNICKFFKTPDSMTSEYTSELVTSPEVAEIAEATPTGIQNAQQLRVFANGKNLFGKLKLIRWVLQAKVAALTNGTDFWQEFSNISASAENASTNGTASTSGSGSGGGGTLSSDLAKVASSNVARWIRDPKDIQEELLGQTAKLIYNHESRNDYTCVNPNDGASFSVGAYQAHGGNAATLLRRIASNDKVDNNTRNVLRKYASWGEKQQGHLNKSQTNELKMALSKYKDITRAATDDLGPRIWNNTYKKWLAPWYDKGDIKDLRSLAMLADISNAGPGFIVNSKITGNSKLDNITRKSFKYHWKPTTKEKELEAVYNTLNSPPVYVKLYKKNVQSVAYDYLKKYAIRKPVSPGQLTSKFGAGNALGFGAGDDLGYGAGDALGYGPEVDTDTAEKASTLSDLVKNTNKVASAASGGALKNVEEYRNEYSKMTSGVIDNFIGKMFDGEDILGWKSSKGSSSSSGRGTAGSASTVTRTGSAGSGRNGIGVVSGNDVSRLLAVALSQVGYQEKKNNSELRDFAANAGKGNYSKYMKEVWNGSNGYGAWCNGFTSWVGKAAGIDKSVYPSQNFVSCANTMNEYKRKGQYFAKGKINPAPGDLVFFNWNGGGRPQHIGIVHSVNSDGTIKTIEGNTSDPSTGNEGVAIKTRNYKTIVGFARPNYSADERSVNVESNLTLGYGLGNVDDSNDTYTVMPDYDVAARLINSGSDLPLGHGLGNTNKTYKIDAPIGFARPNYRTSARLINSGSNLPVGHGLGNNNKTYKIDTPAYREMTREKLNTESNKEFRVDPREFEGLGFGPGMKVDAGFDISSTDSKLEKIFDVIAEWYSTSKKQPASSSDTTNVNIVRSNTNNMVSNTSPAAKSAVTTSQYQKKLAGVHSSLSSRRLARV